MFKAATWRSERNKIKAVFKLQFRATQVHGSGFGSMVVTLVPVDIGKPSLRSEKATVINGECHWPNPIYETVRLAQDPRNRKINDKAYQFLVSTTGGSAKSGVLGETTINLADYFEIFKPSSVSLPLQGSNGAILHVTVQRIQSDVQCRETDESGDAKRQRRTLRSQLSFPENEEYKSPSNINPNKVESFANCPAQVKFHSSRNILLHVDHGGNLKKSSSFGGISASSSESSSGQYTPKENKNNNALQESGNLLSPLSKSDTPQNTDWSVRTAPDGTTFGSKNSSGESGLQEKSTESGSILEKQKSDLVALARQLEVSDLELQTLRKQVVKGSKRGQDISRELSNLKEEGDALKKELDELKASKKKVSEDESISARLQFGTKDPWSMVEEMKKELDHEKNLNANLRLQLEKTQESNSELIFAVRDLEALLKKRDAHEDTQEKECGNRLSHTSHGLQQKPFETSSDHEEGQYALDLLVKEQNDIKPIDSQEEMIIGLSSELELYRKDREDLEMQMEQLALDYEILKQENHDISSRLEQIQLREQLRMQYECSAHLGIINELETHVESLEAELKKQAEAFEANLATLTHEKVELRQRAIEAEDVLRKARWDNAYTAEQLQEETKRLSFQLSTTFSANEKLVLTKVEESRELHLQKSHLEDLLEKTNEELTSVQYQHHVKCQQLLNLIDFKTKEADRLYLDLKAKCEELENQRKYEEARQKDSREEILILKTEMEQLSQENTCFSEQTEQKEKLVAELEELKASTCETEMLLEKRNLERDTLVKQLSFMEGEANKSVEEHSYLRHLKDDQDETVKILKSEVETLKAQYTDLRNSFTDDKLKSENLRKQECLVRGNFWEEADKIANVVKGHGQDDAKQEVSNGTINKEKKSGVASHSSQQAAALNKKLESHEVNLPNGGSDMNEDKQDISTMFELLGRTNLQMNEVTAFGNKRKSQEINITKMNGNHTPETSMADKSSMNQKYNFNGKQVERNLQNNLKKEGEILDSWTCDNRNMAALFSAMANMREWNDSMATELKDMQERYSEMSLKFAEVEGERQQLVITVRTLKTAMK